MLATTAFANGYVSFSNSVATKILVYDYTTLTANPATSGTLGSQTGGSSTGRLVIGLEWGTSASSVNTLASTASISPPTPGVIPGDLYFGLAGTNPGDVDYFQVFAWDSSYGSTLAGMNNCIAAGGTFGAATGTPGVYGSIGTPLAFTLGNVSPAASVPIFGTTAGLFPGFTVISAPEPSTIALAGSAAVSLLLFRRRK